MSHLSKVSIELRLAAKHFVMSKILHAAPPLQKEIFNEHRETFHFQQMSVKGAFHYQTLHIHHSAQWSLNTQQEEETYFWA